MDIDDFKTFLVLRRDADIQALVLACWRKFLSAAHLLEIRSQEIVDLENALVNRTLKLEAIREPFSKLEDRYIEHFYSPQEEMLPHPDGDQKQRWSVYFHHVLLPTLLSNDDLVRDVLRAAGGLPASDSTRVQTVLVHHFLEMTLPLTAPPWARV